MERSQARHRGVSDPSFRDGAIPSLSFVLKIKNRFRTEGTENTEDKLTRDRVLPEEEKICRTKVRLSQGGVKIAEGESRGFVGFRNRPRWLPRDPRTSIAA